MGNRESGRVGYYIPLDRCILKERLTPQKMAPVVAVKERLNTGTLDAFPSALSRKAIPPSLSLHFSGPLSATLPLQELRLMSSCQGD